jgi:hypothetical protein
MPKPSLASCPVGSIGSWVSYFVFFYCSHCSDPIKYLAPQSLPKTATNKQKHIYACSDKFSFFCWLFRSLVTLLLGNVIVNETLPVVLDSELGGGVVAILISTLLIVIFGE